MSKKKYTKKIKIRQDEPKPELLIPGLTPLNDPFIIYKLKMKQRERLLKEKKEKDAS